MKEELKEHDSEQEDLKFNVNKKSAKSDNKKVRDAYEKDKREFCQ